MLFFYIEQGIVEEALVSKHVTLLFRSVVSCAYDKYTLIWFSRWHHCRATEQQNMYWLFFFSRCLRPLASVCFINKTKQWQRPWGRTVVLFPLMRVQSLKRRIRDLDNQMKGTLHYIFKLMRHFVEDINLAQMCLEGCIEYGCKIQETFHKFGGISREFGNFFRVSGILQPLSTYHFSDNRKETLSPHIVLPLYQS